MTQMIGSTPRDKTMCVFCENFPLQNSLKQHYESQRQHRVLNGMKYPFLLFEKRNGHKKNWFVILNLCDLCFWRKKTPRKRGWRLRIKGGYLKGGVDQKGVEPHLCPSSHGHYIFYRSWTWAKMSKNERTYIIFYHKQGF